MLGREAESFAAPGTLPAANTPGPAWATVVLYPWKGPAANDQLLKRRVGEEIMPCRDTVLFVD